MAGFFDQLKGLLFGTQGKFSNQDLLNPQQKQLHSEFLNQYGGAQNAGLQQILSLLNNNPEAFSKFEDPYKRQFQQETVPGLAEQFAGMGSGGSQNSSAFGQALSGAGADLSSNLAALRGQLQNQALGQLQGFQNQAYQPTFQTSYQGPTSGFLSGLFKGAGQGIGQTFGMSNPMMAAMSALSPGSAKI